MSYLSSRMLQHAFQSCPDKDGNEPKPGDLIEVSGAVYSHWAVYIGEGNIVHFGAPGQKGTVLKEKLKDVVKDSTWKINNFLDDRYKPRKDDDIVKEACARVGSSLTYDLINYNCEHFATELRYGKPESRQVREAQADMLMAGAAAVAVGARAVIKLVGELTRK